MAAELAELGYIAYAIDLYEGQVADVAKGAKALVSGVDGTRVIAQLIAAVELWMALPVKWVQSVGALVEACH